MPDADCRLLIASTPRVIDTLMAAMLSPTYTSTYMCSRYVVCTLLCLSFSPETHKFLNNYETYDNIMKLCDKIMLASARFEANKTLIRYCYCLILL